MLSNTKVQRVRVCVRVCMRACTLLVKSKTCRMQHTFVPSLAGKDDNKQIHIAFNVV